MKAIALRPKRRLIGTINARCLLTFALGICLTACEGNRAYCDPVALKARDVCRGDQNQRPHEDVLPIAEQ